MGIATFILKYRLIHVAVQPNTSWYTPEKRENGVITTGAQQGQKYADFQAADGFAATAPIHPAALAHSSPPA